MVSLVMPKGQKFSTNIDARRPFSALASKADCRALPIIANHSFASLALEALLISSVDHGKRILTHLRPTVSPPRWSSSFSASPPSCLVGFAVTSCNANGCS